MERVELNAEMLVAALGDHWPQADIGTAAELLSGGGGQFPVGIRSLPADLVSAVQRERVLAGMLHATAELGYRDLCVEDVLSRAGVSRPTFYEHFENKEDCFLAAFDAAAARLRDRLDAAALGSGGDWRVRVRSALTNMLRFIADEPHAAMVLIVDSRAACPAALVRRDEMLDHFAACLDTQVRAAAPIEAPSAIAAVGIVGGIDALLYSRLNQGETDGLESLLPSLMYFVVLPYEGHEAASEGLGLAVSAELSV
jgi:AcrR family transcriptional regulator